MVTWGTPTLGNLHIYNIMIDITDVSNHLQLASPTCWCGSSTIGRRFSRTGLLHGFSEPLFGAVYPLASWGKPRKIHRTPLKLLGRNPRFPVHRCSPRKTSRFHDDSPGRRFSKRVSQLVQAIEKVAPFFKKCLYLVASKLSLEVVPFWKTQANCWGTSGTSRDMQVSRRQVGHKWRQVETSGRQVYNIV